MIVYEGQPIIETQQNTFPNTQIFTAVFCNYPTAATAQLQNIATIEVTGLSRQEVICDKVINLVTNQIILKPRTFSVTSITGASFNTVLLIDNGSINLGITQTRLQDVTSWAGNTATFSNSQLAIRERSGFANPATAAYSTATSDAIGSANLLAGIGSPTQVVTTGRYILGTFKYITSINIPAQGQVRLKLGNIIFNLL